MGWGLFCSNLPKQCKKQKQHHQVTRKEASQMCHPSHTLGENSTVRTIPIGSEAKGRSLNEIFFFIFMFRFRYGITTYTTTTKGPTVRAFRLVTSDVCFFAAWVFPHTKGCHVGTKLSERGTDRIRSTGIASAGGLINSGVRAHLILLRSYGNTAIPFPPLNVPQ